jgi:hypothetical protein
VTTGAYSVVRNPIYSSVTIFILPAVALLTQSWVYFVPSVFLYAGVMLFIGTEEKQLTKAFGKVYEDYKARVERLVPFKKTVTFQGFFFLSGILAFLKNGSRISSCLATVIPPCSKQP